MQTLSEKLRAIRIAKGYSQEYVAAQLSVSRATYSRIETRPEQLNINQLVHLSQILGIAPARLLPEPDGSENLLSRMTRLESRLEELILKMAYFQSENQTGFS